LILPAGPEYRQFFTGYKKYVIRNLQKLGITLEFSENSSTIDIDRYVSKLCEKTVVCPGVF